MEDRNNMSPYISRQDRDRIERRNKYKKKKKELSLWDILCRIMITTIIVLAIGVAYLWRAQHFLTHFYENTWINGIDCSDMEADEVKAEIQQKVDKYKLEIVTRDGEIYTISGPEISLQYVDDNGVNALLASQQPLLWLQKVLSDSKYEVAANTRYEVKALKNIIKNFPFMQEEEMIAPQDAYVLESDEGYSIVPEVLGTVLDTQTVAEAIEKAVAMGETELVLEHLECYENPTIYQNSADLLNEVRGLNDLTRANIQIKVSGETYMVDRKLLKTWLAQYDNGVYHIALDKIEDYIDTLADKRDSLTEQREFTTYHGETITLKNNKYGWKVNRAESVKALQKAIESGLHGELELVYEQKAQGTGSNDLGDTYIEISIKDQKLWCWKNGAVFIEAPIVSGLASEDAYATPTDGCWYIYRKTTKYTIKGPVQENGEPEYTEFVQYWLPFNGGVGICDNADRGDAFGGDIYLENGSHGSVQVSLEVMQQIYDAVSVGTAVIVYE